MESPELVKPNWLPWVQKGKHNFKKICLAIHMASITYQQDGKSALVWICWQVRHGALSSPILSLCLWLHPAPIWYWLFFATTSIYKYLEQSWCQLSFKRDNFSSWLCRLQKPYVWVALRECPGAMTLFLLEVSLIHAWHRAEPERNLFTFDVIPHITELLQKLSSTVVGLHGFLLYQ